MEQGEHHRVRTEMAYSPPNTTFQCILFPSRHLTCMLVKSLQSCLTLRPHGLQPIRLLCSQDFPGKNTGVGCHFLLQEVFLTQGSNPRLLHWQAGSLPLGVIPKIFGHFSLYDEPQSKIPTQFKLGPGSYSQQLKPDTQSEERKRSATLVHSSHMVTTWFLQDRWDQRDLETCGPVLCI